MGVVEDMVWILQRRHGGDGSDVGSTLFNYDLRKEDCLF